MRRKKIGENCFMKKKKVGRIIKRKEGKERLKNKMNFKWKTKILKKRREIRKDRKK